VLYLVAGSLCNVEKEPNIGSWAGDVK